MTTHTEPIDQQSELTRMVRAILDEHGSMCFAELLARVRAGIYVHAGTFHDLMNNLITAGLVKVRSTGWYTLP